MYKKNPLAKTSLTGVKAYKAETLEKRVFRMINNKEPITDTTPLGYSERGEGVLPGTDIRTDRFEVALDATTTINKVEKAKREHKMGEKAKKGMAEEAKTDRETGGQSTHATE